MNTVVTYRFTQSYNFDPTQNKVIETRFIKRVLLESIETDDNIVTTTRTQILKAMSKKYDVLGVSKRIAESIKNGGMNSLSVDITREQCETYMQKTFDLFKLKTSF